MKISLFGCIALAMMLLLPAPQPATAQSSSGQSTGVTRQDDRVGQIFSDLEKRIIREVLEGTGAVDADKEVDKDSDDDKGKGNKAAKGPGKGQKSGLPPGLDRRALPADLEDRLPDRTDTERVIVGSDVVLIEKGTDLVLDVIRDVIRQKTGTSQ